MSLARVIPPTETTKLGIELLASVSKVDNVMMTNASEDMELKTFRVSQHSLCIPGAVNLTCKKKKKKKEGEINKDYKRSGL